LFLTAVVSVDVIARDERGYEDADHCHRPVRAFDPAYRLLRSSPPSLFLAPTIRFLICSSGYELRGYVVRPEAFRPPVLGDRDPDDGFRHRHILLVRL
jgi:hypothetical protein